MSTPIVSFYLPDETQPLDRLPEGDDIASYSRRFLAQGLHWTWQTYHYLAADGFPCQLVSQLPERGIIVCVASTLPVFYRPGPGQFIVCCVADNPPRFFMPCQIFQSATQARTYRSIGGFPYIGYMPFWPQPGLLPRVEDRGDEFRHVDFFGGGQQLAPELHSPDFVARLRDLGLELRLNYEHYHDYRSTDVVLAVRRFDPNVVMNKPASKLVNAWRAGTPAVLGTENGFRELRRSPLDYLEVKSVDDCIAALARLRNEPGLRAAMAENGRRRAEEFSVPNLTRRWRELLGVTLPAYYESWLAIPWPLRQCFFAERAVRRFGASFARRVARRPSDFL